MQGKGALTIWILPEFWVSYLRPVEAEEWSDPANLSNGDWRFQSGYHAYCPGNRRRTWESERYVRIRFRLIYSWV